MANRLAKIVNKPKAGKQKPVPVKIVSDYPSTAAVDKSERDKYRTQDALRTLQRAAEIQRDKPLMKAVKAEAKSEIKRLSGVCGSKK